MKTLLILFVALTSIKNAVSQESKPVEYTEVVQVDSVSAVELFHRAKLWFGKTYKKKAEVITHESETEGEILATANMKYNSGVFVASESIRGFIYYNIKIYFKEGRFKYTFTDFVHVAHEHNVNKFDFGLISTDEDFPRPKNNSSSKWYRKVWDDLKSTVEYEVGFLIKNLKYTMLKERESQKDDW